MRVNRYSLIPGRRNVWVSYGITPSRREPRLHGVTDARITGVAVDAQPGGNGGWGHGERLEIDYTFNEPVVVTSVFNGVPDATVKGNNFRNPELATCDRVQGDTAVYVLIVDLPNMYELDLTRLHFPEGSLVMKGTITTLRTGALPASATPVQSSPLAGCPAPRPPRPRRRSLPPSPPPPPSVQRVATASGHPARPWRRPSPSARLQPSTPRAAPRAAPCYAPPTT